MKKLKKYRFFANVLSFIAVVVILSGCMRGKGLVSVNSEKLRKQSSEIENSYSVGSVPKKDEILSASNSEDRIILPQASSGTVNKISSVPQGKKEKLSVAEKIVLKKISKKLSPEKKAQIKRSNIDQKLKMAIIFGGVGVILLILGGISGVFWILGTIAIVIGLVFLLIWAIENL